MSVADLTEEKDLDEIAIEELEYILQFLESVPEIDNDDYEF